ncbi:hypothetical protein [Arthrobacter sp. RCC_34]|uniref:hypothetical protein n=1 Tax=Arthrobacter sp. RCC_34 TaxID=3239230 RepID=UPI003525577D
MQTQLDSTRNRIRALAISARGTRTREQLIQDSPVNMSTYADFETGKRWPRAVTLRRIEELLGWKSGVIDEAMASGIEPELLELEHMAGGKTMSSTPRTLRGYSDMELLSELVRRTSEREAMRLPGSDYRGPDYLTQDDYDIAASNSLGEGIRKGEYPVE